jgi:hypothetical protein
VSKGTLTALLVLCALVGAALDRPADFAARAAVQESLAGVHPRFRADWLRQRGLDNSDYTTFRRPDSGAGLRLVGRWPWGPSWELCGRDSLLFLGSGSGVRILSIADSAHPRQLGQISCRGLVSQVAVRDSLLFVACGAWGAQLYSVADPAAPRELGTIDAVVVDLCIRDSLCYTVGGDSLRIYNVANASEPEWLSSRRDSGSVVAAAAGHLYSAGRYTMNVYDVGDPVAPIWVNSRGGAYLAVETRNSLLFCTGIQPSYFTILDIVDPADIRPLSTLNDYGGGDLCVAGHYVYLSCTYNRHGLFVIDIADSTSPQVRGSYIPDGAEQWEPYVPESGRHSYLACWYGGLSVADVRAPYAPTEIWSGFKAYQAVDVDVDGSRAYVADAAAGLQLLDVTSSADPQQTGQYDTLGGAEARAVVARDSFAFLSWFGGSGRRFLRVLNVADPSQPTLVAAESCFNAPQDMVLRDSLIYAAEANRFQIFNVARPRQPVLVGSCVAGDLTRAGLVVGDTVAYFVGSFDGMQVFSVANPAAPRLLATVGDIRAMGCDVVDTLLYVGDYDDSLHIWSVANPAQPRQVSSVYATRCGYGVAVIDRYAYVGCDARVRVFDVSNPMNPREVASGATPYEISRVVTDGQHVYVCCWDAGVCIFDSTSTGIAGWTARRREHLTPNVCPSPARDRILIRQVGRGAVRLRDAAGRTVAVSPAARGASLDSELDISGLSPGVYFAEDIGGEWVCKFVKQ